ncbi:MULTISPECIES: nucleotidyl transferase AbiEii/AbiGii toxin family protein [Idiomarina]|uniref:nucleotidyl transferase AbiEii/AbiGii toxin family protein n=1 Tax=Idiomarina TaxID=135575 RepID=UPI00129CC7AD|nr:MULTISPECIES: nucleotidyl transferase AbiEii/AbiGii toxin family protein [Idiomarina]
MDIFDYYRTEAKRAELKLILDYAAQNSARGLAANFLEKDIWVTEILRLLYEEDLLDSHDVAFKGGTALSKCYSTIERFSEDIDLSIHWADLAESGDEAAVWELTTRNPSQQRKFRREQRERLEGWTNEFVQRLNGRLSDYGIEGLNAEIEEGSGGEKIDVHFPHVAFQDDSYQLEHVLLEFGGRNRGRPTVSKPVTTYLSEIDAVAESHTLPKAAVEAYHPDYIIWEKLTALHQFCTQENSPDTVRLSRHWYDVDCILQNLYEGSYQNMEALQDVVAMKSARWATRGVSFEVILSGELVLIPTGRLLEDIKKDYDQSVSGGMFFSTPDSFADIIERLAEHQDLINRFLNERR